MYQLHVEGMTCNHCVSRVTRSVKKIDDAAKVDIDLKSGKVTVDSASDLEDICAAISEAGYEVKSSDHAK
jgi:copper ion binding protein